MSEIINNKWKQFFGKNWSSNKFVKKNTKIKDFDSQENKHRSKKKKAKKKTFFPWVMCPFCNERLVDKFDKNTDSLRWFFSESRKLITCKCGAKIMKESCPACNNDTWFKDGIFKHQWMGCGFEGKKLNH